MDQKVWESLLFNIYYFIFAIICNKFSGIPVRLICPEQISVKHYSSCDDKVCFLIRNTNHLRNVREPGSHPTLSQETINERKAAIAETNPVSLDVGRFRWANRTITQLVCVNTGRVESIYEWMNEKMARREWVHLLAVPYGCSRCEGGYSIWNQSHELHFYWILIECGDRCARCEESAQRIASTSFHQSNASRIVNILYVTDRTSPKFIIFLFYP